MITIKATNMYDIAKELRDAGFFVGVRRYAEPLFISWKEKKQ